MEIRKVNDVRKSDGIPHMAGRIVISISIYQQDFSVYMCEGKSFKLSVAK